MVVINKNVGTNQGANRKEKASITVISLFINSILPVIKREII